MAFVIPTNQIEVKNKLNSLLISIIGKLIHVMLIVSTLIPAFQTPKEINI